MTREEVQIVAKESATAAVTQMFVALGVNARDPEAVLAMQKDMAYLRSWRESVTTIRKQSLKTAIIVITSGILGGLWMLLSARHP